MRVTFEQGKEEITKLVDYFRINRAAFLVDGVNEAQIRQNLIDPMFEALGWDIGNKNRVAPQYREVIIEEGFDIQGKRFTPDYTFRVGSTPKFFVEAKKCSTDIKEASEPAFQLRRYAWSSNHALSILANFEALAVYDCAIRPFATDKAGAARILYLTWEEYPRRWKELWDIVSHEAVWSGAFDHYSQSKRGKRGTSPVGKEFLKEIEGWRDELARSIALRNPNLPEEDLNRAVQLTIDRIIFLRMAEDRRLETYESLLHLSRRENIYKHFIEVICQRADAKYNSGIFDLKADQRFNRLMVDDKPLCSILQSLYYEHGSSYDFRAMPVEIIGTVYEQFLGRTITLTSGHRARIEEKPEVRKAGGVYYTPSYIVDYIIRNSIGKAIDARSPKQLQGEGRGKIAQPYSILDMACGSGSFLLAAYKYLLDVHLKWYTQNNPERWAKQVNPPIFKNGLTKAIIASRARQSTAGAEQAMNRGIQNQANDGPDWRLSIQEKKRILTTHIFGVDIDRQAVEVTKLSLLLKVLEEETDESLGKQLDLFSGVERALPNLDQNIKCGNSLIGPAFFARDILPDMMAMKRINAFDWTSEFPEIMKAGGFDCVIGNPPYVRIQTMKEWAPQEAEIYKDLYEAAKTGNYDLYVVFVEKSLQLLNKSGQLAYILPHKFFTARYGEALRKIISNGNLLSQMVHFGDQQIFEGATTYTCLMFLDKTRKNEFLFRKANDLEKWKLAEFAVDSFVPSSSLSSGEWHLLEEGKAALLARLSDMPCKLHSIAEKIFQGLVTSADQVYLLEPMAQPRKGLVPVKCMADGKEYELETEIAKPLCKGSLDIRRYIARPSKRAIFPYDEKASLQTGKTVLYSKDTLAKIAPKVWKYLSAHYDTLRNREKGKMRHEGWYGYVYPKSVCHFAEKKILTPSIAAHASFALDREGSLYFVGSGGGGGGGYGITLRNDCNLAYEYVIGLLNSRLLDWFMRNISSQFRGGYFAFSRQYIEQIPIRQIDFKKKRDKANHDRIVRCAENMMTLHQHLFSTKFKADKEILQRQVDAVDREIDSAVYDLYDMTKEEIAYVEE